jgi:hypothetical protein
MTNFQLMRLVTSYELRFGRRVNTQLIRTGRTRDGYDLEEALLAAIKTGNSLPELAEKARVAPVTSHARCRLRQKRYRLVPRKRRSKRGAINRPDIPHLLR